MRRWLYVGVRRDWFRGTKILFARKADAFIASGVIGRVAALDEFDPGEKELCIENNWFAKMFFQKLTRFYPEVHVSETILANINPVTLHGSQASADDVVKIEARALCRINV
jgi:hypothetical protein